VADGNKRRDNRDINRGRSKNSQSRSKSNDCVRKVDMFGREIDSNRSISPEVKSSRRSRSRSRDRGSNKRDSLAIQLQAEG
jgi:hypothetical protein